MADARVLEIILRARDEASKVLDHVGNKAGGLSSLAGAAGGIAAGAGAAAVAAVAAVAAGLNTASNAAEDYGQHVLTIQRLTGESAQASSQWAAILDRYGVSGSAAGRVIKSLDSAIVGHNKALAAAGIATQTANGQNRTSTAVLSDLARYYSTATDKTAAVALASKVLGKGYMSLLPVLANGKSGIDDLTASAAKNGLILSQGGVDAARKYGAAVKDNAEAMKGLTVQAGMAVLPIKTQIVQALGTVFAYLNAHRGEIGAFFQHVSAVVRPVLAYWLNTYLPAMLSVYAKVGAGLQKMWAFMQPVLAKLWQVVKDSLIPAWNNLKEAWNSPDWQRVLPVLKTVAAFLAGGLFLSIVGAIAVVAKLVQAVAWLIKTFVELPTTIKRAFASLGSELQGPVDQVRKALSYLDPFARHSPSLVDQVQSGVGVIAKHYASLGGLSVGAPHLALAGGSTVGASDVNARLLAVLERIEREGVRSYLGGAEVSRQIGLQMTRNSRAGVR